MSNTGIDGGWMIIKEFLCKRFGHRWQNVNLDSQTLQLEKKCTRCGATGIFSIYASAPPRPSVPVNPMPWPKDQTPIDSPISIEKNGKCL